MHEAQKKIVVGSKNPVKIEATRLAFEKVWPKDLWKVSGFDAASGVPDQPMSDEESITGARNRAKAALDSDATASYGVGLEGGLQQIGENWFDCGWIVVLDRNENEGIGSTARLETPNKMMDYIKEGKELGEVADILFDKENSKQAEGHFGLVTNNVVTRTSGYTDGVVMALARFLHPRIWS